MTKGRIQQYGISVDLPRGWEGVIYRRQPEPGATTHPVVHAANFALPSERGDYGSGAVDRMAPGDVFVSLLEFHPASATRPLFADNRRPQGLAAADFSANSLQQRLPGQAGAQRFFTENGRAFCLYVVLGDQRQAAALVTTANQIIQALQIAKVGG